MNAIDRDERVAAGHATTCASSRFRPVGSRAPESRRRPTRATAAGRQRPPAVFFDANRDGFVARGIKVGEHRGGGGERDLVFARSAAVNHANAKLVHRRLNLARVLRFSRDPHGWPRPARCDDDGARRGPDAGLHAGGHTGAVKGVLHRDLEQMGAEILLANTYHLYLRPGDDLIARRGGLHAFIGWPRPSSPTAAVQVFSLAARRTWPRTACNFGRTSMARASSDAGKGCRRAGPARIGHRDGVRRVPGASVRRRAGASVHGTDAPMARRARGDFSRFTKRRARRTLKGWRDRDHLGQAQFGIVQGGISPEWREESARARSGSASRLTPSVD